MNNNELKQCLRDFLAQPEIKLLKYYRVLKPHGDFLDCLNAEERQNGFLRTLNEDEEVDPYKYDDMHIYPPEVVVAAMKEFFKNNTDWIYPEYKVNDIQIIIIVPELENNTKLAIDSMERAGYFLARRERELKDVTKPFGQTWVVMQFEPYHTVDVSEEIYAYNNYLLHATPTKNVPGIKENGIVPSALNKLYKYPPRIYLMFSDYMHVGTTNRRFLKFVDKLKEVSGIDDYSLLLIEPSKLQPGLRFYYDPFHPGGLYTYQSINADAIEDVIRPSDFKPYV